jgi:hypothetical protein
MTMICSFTEFSSQIVLFYIAVFVITVRVKVIIMYNLGVFNLLYIQLYYVFIGK